MYAPHLRARTRSSSHLLTGGLSQERREAVRRRDCPIPSDMPSSLPAGPDKVCARTWGIGIPPAGAGASDDHGRTSVPLALQFALLQQTLFKGSKHETRLQATAMHTMHVSVRSLAFVFYCTSSSSKARPGPTLTSTLPLFLSTHHKPGNHTSVLNHNKKNTLIAIRTLILPL